jgi:putative ABC transport system permease protein
MMIDFDKWQEILSSMKRHKLRTFLTALSVWWGIFMLVLLLGMGKGLQNSVEHNFRDDAINSLWINSWRTSKPFKGLPPGRYIRFTNDDYNLLKSQIPEIEFITGRYYLRGEFNIEYKNKSLSFDVRSVHPDHQVLENTIITEGRFLNNIDLKEYRKVCVIGKIVAEDFFGKGVDPIGEYLSVKGTDYKVVGVFRDEGHENEMRKIYLPVTTAQRVDSANGRLHRIMATIGDATVEESLVIENKVRKLLAERHKFAIDDESAIYISNEVEDYQEFQMVFAFIKGFIWFVGIGSIIAGVIGVSNIMLIVIKDRTKEIGISKAMGATPFSIIGMVMQEAVFLTSLAGYLGLITGFGLIYGMNYLMIENKIELEFFRNPEVDFLTVLTALIFLICCGAISGLIPAVQAVRINPVTAMKS